MFSFENFWHKYIYDRFIFLGFWVFEPFFEPFLTKISFLTKILIFDQNFDFWPKFRFLTKILIFDQNFDFWPKFWFRPKIWIWDQNLDFRPKFRTFDQNCYFLTKNFNKKNLGNGLASVPSPRKTVSFVKSEFFGWRHRPVAPIRLRLQNPIEERSRIGSISRSRRRLAHLCQSL